MAKDARWLNSTPTQGKQRFGKMRARDCECDYNYTCRACLADADNRNRAERYPS
jgi:hypothetical protein